MIKHTKRVSRSTAGNVTVIAFLLLFGVFMILPLYYMVISSLKPTSELFYFPPKFYVVKPTVQNFLNLIKLQSQSDVPFERYLFNSVFVTVVATVGYVLIASMAAYALSKHKFPLKKYITQGVVFAILFRPEVTSVPLYILMVKTGVIDNYWAVILPAMAGSFGVFLLQQFLDNVPNEMIEAARIDGAGEFRIYWQIVMPLVKPAWLTLLVTTFQSVWNAGASGYVWDESLKTFNTAIAQIGTVSAGASSAGSVVMMSVPIIIFIVNQSKIVETMGSSGMKD